MNYDISIKFDGVRLIPVDYLKYLGMFIGNYLSWNYHILQLSEKLSRANDILSKLRHYASIEICLQVYYAIFYSHLIYVCNIWGLTSEENLKKIEIFQKKCISIMNFSDSRSYTNLLFIKLKVLKVREIIQLQQLKHIYEFLGNSLPDDLKVMFQLTRHLFHIPAVNSTTYGPNSIRYSVPKLYYDTFKNNSIATDSGVKILVNLDHIHNIFQFKRVLKKHFLYSYSLH